MGDGKLDGKLVSENFWPRCTNCAFFEECEKSPKHPAFPHIWHWSHETHLFLDGLLVLRSWVGTAAYGEDHTGCYSYQVDEKQILPLKEQHKLYIRRWQRANALDQELSRLEADGVYNDTVEKKYQELFALWKILS